MKPFILIYLENQLGGAWEEEHVVVDELLVAVVGRQGEDLRPLAPPLILSHGNQHQSCLGCSMYKEVLLDFTSEMEVLLMLFERCHTKIERYLSNSIYEILEFPEYNSVRPPCRNGLEWFYR